MEIVNVYLKEYGKVHSQKNITRSGIMDGFVRFYNNDNLIFVIPQENILYWEWVEKDESI